MTVLTLQPSEADATNRDTYIKFQTSATNYGGAAILELGTDLVGKAQDLARIILRFDLSSIPINSTINSATLTLTISSGTITTDTFKAHRITQPSWTELGVTYSKYDGITNWAAAGGDFDPTVEDSVVISSAVDLVMPNLATMGQDALDNRSGFFDVLIKGNQSGGVRWLIYHSSGAGAAQRPKLVLDYTEPPPANLCIDEDFFTDEDIYVSGNVEFKGGTSTLANSSWVIDGTCGASSGVTFAPNAFAGSSWVVGGNFAFNGTQALTMDLAALSAWTLTVTGAGTASFVNVAFSDASAGSTIFATNSTDGDDNQNWNFDFITIEEALIVYLETHSDFSSVSIFGGRLPQKNASYPAITFNRLSGGLTEDLTQSLGILEPVFQFHCWDTSQKGVKDLIRNLWQAFHSFSGQWGIAPLAVPIRQVQVESHVDLPTARAGDLEHNAIYHSMLSVRIFHADDIPTFASTTISVANSDSIEEALLGYLNQLTVLNAFPIHYMSLPTSNYPALMVERFSGGYEQDLTESLGLQEGTYRIHIYAPTYKEIAQIADLVWQNIHSFQGTWGDLSVKASVVDNSDQPIESGTDIEHQSQFHRVIEIQLMHEETIPSF